MRNLAASPYFFKRTTLSVLLALVKGAKGAQLDNALGNINIILPMIWGQLRKPEKWQTGQTYAEIYNAGKEQAVAGLKKALIKVRGFDFVPENLRSTIFLQAAQKVIEAHDDFNNFHNEPAPILGGHLKTGQSWTGQNRPVGARPKHECSTPVPRESASARGRVVG